MGSASFSLFLLGSFSVHVDFTTGQSLPQAGPAPVDAGAKLAAELAELNSWHANLGEDARGLVHLRDLAADPVGGAHAGLLLHPFGTLTCAQRLLPLDQ